MAVNPFVILIATALMVKTCLMLCLPSELGPNCVQKCPNNNVIFQQNCIRSCPLYTVTKETAFSTYCYSQSELPCQAITCSDRFPKCYHINCLQICPEFTVEYNRTCLMECPKYASLLIAHDCKGVCLEGRKTCIEKCPASHPFTFIAGLLKMCLDSCPEFTVPNGGDCVLNCPTNASLILNSTCISQCPASHPYVKLLKSDYNELFTCVEACPKDTVLDESRCVDSCPTGKNLFNNTCVKNCPDSHIYLKNNELFIDQERRTYSGRSNYECSKNCDELFINGNFCTSSCPSSAPFVFNQSLCVSHCGDEFEYVVICAKSCPQYTYKYIYDDFKCPSCSQKRKACTSSCPPHTFTYNSSCIFACPDEAKTNYTRNNDRLGLYTCVSDCPVGTVTHNGTCYDTCPDELNSHLSICKPECPKSHPYTNTKTKECLIKCPKELVGSENNICVKRCPKDTPFIEKGRCVKACIDARSVYEITIHGKLCHKQCPHHLVLMENTCRKRCPDGWLSVYDVCKKLDKCPNHRYIEHSGIGQRCTNMCSKGFFLDGTYCVLECSKEKVIAGHKCLKSCPSSLPFGYKTYTGKVPRIICYSVCPPNYLANGSVCIHEKECRFYRYDHGCHVECPTMTIISINDKKPDDCVKMTYYIVFLLLILVAAGVLCALLYFRTFYTGTCRPDKKVNLNVNQSIRTSNKDLLHAEETIELNKNDPNDNGNNDTDFIKEIDDGYKHV